MAAQRGGRTEQISRHCGRVALRLMLWRHFSAEEPWVLEWIRIYHRIRVDGRIRFDYATCGRGNFWIRKEKVADSKISGYGALVMLHHNAYCDVTLKHCSVYAQRQNEQTMSAFFVRKKKQFFGDFAHCALFFLLLPISNKSLKRQGKIS